MAEPVLRVGEAADVPSVLDIYSYYVDNTIVSFEYGPLAPAVFAERTQTIMAQFPLLVLEEGKSIIGYAYAHDHIPRKAYQWNAELTIYLRHGCTGEKKGHALYSALLSLLKAQGYHNAYACIAIPNPSSVRFHESFGFSLIGIFKKSGFKFDQWRDMAWFEKYIGDTNPPVSDPLAFSQLDAQTVREILDRACQA